ncbi:hypothetical protein I3842_13G050900 [Carya illinoinensis]|uniref:Uncharacterized protein n=1 Tax=Carya illinoinensis TaxID=32201 RepID=A0A922AKC4_CARIL|nr:hypothetical protein I3842_13G050900 [Carya illinoinensis]
MDISWQATVHRPNLYFIISSNSHTRASFVFPLHSSRNHPISFLFSFFSRKHFFSSSTQAIPILSIVRFSSSTCKPPSIHHPYSCRLLAVNHHPEGCAISSTNLP